MTEHEIRWKEIGKQWELDSRLEKWFPFTAEELTTLRERVKELEVRIDTLDRIKFGFIKSNSEIEQALGRALGYPRFCDDQKNFPGSTDADGVCVGEHVAESIADEAAKRIRELEESMPRPVDLRAASCDCVTTGFTIDLMEMASRIEAVMRKGEG